MKKIKVIVPEIEIVPRISGEVADKIKSHCHKLFVEPMEKIEVVCRIQRIGRGIRSADLAPRGDGARDAFERDLNMMLTELDYPENALDDYDMDNI